MPSDRALVAIPTNDDLTLLLVGCPFAHASTFRRDVEASYFEAIEREPELAHRVRAATRAERFSGGGVPNFYRKPYGPGWVLVGDAGYTKDPVTAQGIANAFADAERTAAALGKIWSGKGSFDSVMGRCQAERDEATLPMYEFTTRPAMLEPPPPEFFDPDNLARLLQTMEAQ